MIDGLPTSPLRVIWADALAAISERGYMPGQAVPANIFYEQLQVRQKQANAMLVLGSPEQRASAREFLAILERDRMRIEREIAREAIDGLLMGV
jgi:hypothetical protein